MGRPGRRSIFPVGENWSGCPQPCGLRKRRRGIRPGRGDHDQRRQAGRRDQEGRKGRPDTRDRLFGCPTSRSSGKTSPRSKASGSSSWRHSTEGALTGSLRPRPGQEAGRADRRDQRAADGGGGRAAVRAGVLVAVGHGAGLRLQHDANQLRETALARDEHLLPRRALCRRHLRQRLQTARRTTLPIPSGGTSETTSAACWAAGGTPIPPRTS